MKNFFDLMKQRRNALRPDKGDAVLVTVLISIPLLCACFFFATSVSLATWQQTSYLSSAQAAATASLQTVQSDGYLGANSMQSFVREYLSQTGRGVVLAQQQQNAATGAVTNSTATGQAAGASETQGLSGGQCSTAMINGVKRNLPYIELQLDITRGVGESTISTYPYYNEGTTVSLKNPSVGAGTIVNGQQYRVINAKVWEASNNITFFGLGSVGKDYDLECQPYNVSVSAILFGSNEDLAEGEQCFQPDVIPENPKKVQQIKSTETSVTAYESPLTTCEVRVANLTKNQVVTVLGTYRNWSYIEVAPEGSVPGGTKGWVPTNKLENPAKWSITAPLNCDSLGCPTVSTSIPTEYSWANNNTTPVAIPNPSKPHHSSSGWVELDCSTGKPLSGPTAIPSGTNFKITFGKRGDICLEPLFSVNNYSIEWDANGGSGGKAPQNYPYGSSVPVPANATMPGHISNGWFTAATDGTKVSGTVAVGGNSVYYQQYSKIDYTISMNQNGGSGGSLGATSYTIGTSARTVSLAIPTRTGHTFSGWTITGASGITVNSADTQMTIPAGSYGNITVRADWSATANKISVDNNGGSGGAATPDEYRISNSKQYITLTEPDRLGYTFNGWTIPYQNQGIDSTITGNTLNIQAGAYGNLQVRASWVATNYSITLDPNGGSSVNDPADYRINSSDQTRGLTEPTRANYEFTGWSITGNSYPNSSVSGNTLTIKANATGSIKLRANWAAIYNITTNANGGSGGAQDRTYTVSSSTQNISMPAPSRGGYSFDGWDVSGTSGATSSGTTLTIPANATGAIALKATWAGNKYTVSLNQDGGSTGSIAPTQYVTDGVTTKLTIDPPTRTGYALDGYTVTTQTSNGTTTVSGNTISIPANAYGAVTVRADWAARSYNINYTCMSPTASACAGTADGSSATYTFSSGAQTKALGSKGVISGWTFDGWTKVSGPGTISGYNISIPANATGDIKVKADWKKTNSLPGKPSRKCGTGSSAQMTATICMEVNSFRWNSNNTGVEAQVEITRTWKNTSTRFNCDAGIDRSDGSACSNADGTGTNVSLVWSSSSPSSHSASMTTPSSGGTYPIAAASASTSISWSSYARYDSL